MADRQAGPRDRCRVGEDRLRRGRYRRRRAAHRLRELTTTTVDLFDRQLLFVTGKGGVGKTSIAAALATLAVRRGKRTLLCEMDAKGALAAAFEVGELGFTPTTIEPGLSAMSMNTEDSLREYLKLFVRIPLVGRLGPLAHTFDFVADAAPGVKEILAVGKLCYEVREQHHDLVVVDAEATGHIVAQIDAPRAIRDLVHVGLVRDQTSWMLEILDDPRRTGLVIATTPEEMPVTETIELIDRVRAETRVGIAAVIANRVMPALFATRDAELFDRLASPSGRELLSGIAGVDVGAVVAAAELLEYRRRIGAEHLGRLRAVMAETDLAPLVMVPELFTRAAGRRVVNLIAAALGEELS